MASHVAEIAGTGTARSAPWTFTNGFAMRLIHFTSLALLILSARSSAQAPSQRAAKPNATSDLNAFLRTKGDTLWFTVIREGLPGRPRDPNPMVLLVRDTTAFLLAENRPVPMPAAMVKIIRYLYSEARACRQPAVGCEMDEALLAKLPH
jgi:hypothetical protein